MRISKGGYGLDLNHPETWAAIAADQSDSDYACLIRPVLEIIGLEDKAPQNPEPKDLKPEDYEIKSI